MLIFILIHIIITYSSSFLQEPWRNFIKILYVFLRFFRFFGEDGEKKRQALPFFSLSIASSTAKSPRQGINYIAFGSHIVGTGGLAAARSRSGSDNPPDCHSRPSRRFATSTVQDTSPFPARPSARCRAWGVKTFPCGNDLLEICFSMQEPASILLTQNQASSTPAALGAK